MQRNKKPCLSIITASYNSEKTITDTIKSVLTQSFVDYEYFIVDGGSSDRTVDIIKSYESDFEGKLKWISESDMGIYDAWNKGLQLTAGEWVCFIGSDDVLLPDALNLYFEEAKYNPDINFISSRVELVDSQSRCLGTIGLPWSSKMKHYCCIAHVGSWHKRSLFEVYGLYSLDYKICSDYEFLLRNYYKITPGYVASVTAKMCNSGVSNMNPYGAYKETYLIKNKCGLKFKCINYLFYLITILSHWYKIEILK